MALVRQRFRSACIDEPRQLLFSSELMEGVVTVAAQNDYWYAPGRLDSCRHPSNAIHALENHLFFSSSSGNKRIYSVS